MTGNTDELLPFRSRQLVRSALHTDVGALFLAASLIIVAAFHVATLSRFPAMEVDEGWMASRAWAWLQTGLNFGPLDAGAWDRFPGHWTVLPLLPTLVHATFIKLLGLKLSSVRSASLVGGLVLLSAVYFIAVALQLSWRGRFLALLLISTSFPFLYSSHLGRPDVFVSALGFSAIAVYLTGSRRRRAVHSLLAGLLIGAAFEFHPNGAIYAPVIATLILMDDGRYVFHRRSVWAFAVGIGLGLAWYAWLHIMPYPQTYVAMMSRKIQITHTPPVISGGLSGGLLASISRIADNVLYFGEYLFVGTTGRMVAMLFALVALLCSQTAINPESLVMPVVAIAAATLLIRNRVGHYLILVSPFVDIFLAVWIDKTLQAGSKNNRWLFASRVASDTIIALSIVVTLVTVANAPPPGEQALAASHIRPVVPQAGTVMGAQTYWFDLYDVPYLSWQQVLRYQWFEPGSTFEQAMKALHPDVLVVDDHLRSFIVAGQLDTPRAGVPPNAWDRGLPKQEVDAFLDRYGTLDDSLQTAAFGTVEIYVLHWDR